MSKILDKIKSRSRLGYESEIRIALGLLIFLLILTNFGTILLFNQSKKAFFQEFDNKLSSIAFVVKAFWEEEYEIQPEKAKSFLQSTVFDFNLKEIAICDTQGVILVSSAFSKNEKLNWNDYGMNEQIQQSLKAGLKVFSEIFTLENKRTYKTFFLPYHNLSNGKLYIIVIKSPAQYLETLEHISLWDALIHFLVFISATVMAIFFIKFIIHPYRQLRKKIEEEKLLDKEKIDREDKDIAVEAFEKIIADLKRKEALLSELYKNSEKRSETLANFNDYLIASMNNGILICDASGKITTCNQLGEQILDLTEAQLLNRNYKTALTDFPDLKEIVEKTLYNARGVNNQEIRIVAEQKQKLYLNISTSVIKDRSHNILGAALFFTDITDLKNLQEKISSQEKLAALGEMSSGLAHQLRNSMAAITGFVKLLKKNITSKEKALKVAGEIEGESSNLENMLSSFLSFVRPGELNLEKANLKDIMRESFQSVRQFFRKKNILLVYKETQDIPGIYADVVLLKQCFQNLFKNSWEAMSEGKIEIRVSVVDKSEYQNDSNRPESSLLAIVIKDTGCGIEKKNLEKIFNPFFTTKTEGTGLGLSIVKKIITLHQGRIEVESEIGQGTTFKIWLPVKIKLPSKAKIIHSARA